MNVQIISAFFCLALVVGCGKQSPLGTSSKAEARLSEKGTLNSNRVSPSEDAIHSTASTASTGDSAGAIPKTPLEQALTGWKKGDKTAAIQGFLAIDWKKNEKPFGPESPLNLREKDLSTMSAADRERAMGQVMLQLKDLKQLATAVREKGTAAAATDPELARRCFAKVDECGGALDQPEALKIVQLVSRAIRKAGAPEFANPGQ